MISYIQKHKNMKVIEHIKNAKETLFSFELLPPLKGKDIKTIYNIIDPLMEFNPKYINITSHRDEITYENLDNGLLKRKSIRRRPGTVAIAAAIHYKYNITVVPHIICSGFTKSETEYALIDLNFLDLNNLLVLRGDPLKTEKYFIPEKGGHLHTLDIIEQINNLNKGIYLDTNIKNAAPTNFSFGVAGYPEKHSEAPNMKSDIKYLKMKVDAGADYIVTQMFFDNQKYYDFVDLCRAEDINVPIIPGLKPLNLINQINVLPQVFHVDIPELLASEISKCKTNNEAKEIGIEWTIQQAKDLMKHKVPVLHFYTMGAGTSVRKVAEAVF